MRLMSMLFLMGIGSCPVSGGLPACRMAYLSDRLQVQILGIEPTLGLDHSHALNGDIDSLVRIVCVVEEGDLHVVDSHIDLSEGYRASILAVL